MPDAAMDRRLRVLFTLASSAALCAWLQSWRSLPSAIYDVSLGVGLFGYLAATIMHIRLAGLDRRRVVMILALGVACAVAAGRLFVGYAVPISGHMTVLTTVLGLALLERESSPRARAFYALPWLAVLLTRWTALEGDDPGQTLGALALGAALVLPVWLRDLWNRRSPIRWFVLAAVAYPILCAVAGVCLIEGALRPARLPNDDGARERLAALGKVEDVEVTSGDARLRGWYVVPANDRGSAVIALHGIADRRSSMVAYAELLARDGFRVLLTDQRGHGESEGGIATYGVIEAQDVVVWQRWLVERGARAVLGLGASLGGAVLLQAPRAGAKLEGVIAEASYSSLADVAEDRIAARALGTSWPGRLVIRPILCFGVLYARLRYGVDLGRANPAEAIAATTVPVLLIHGGADAETPPGHSVAIRDARPGHTELWIVPGASHCGAWKQATEEFERRVIEWLDARSPR